MLALQMTMPQECLQPSGVDHAIAVNRGRLILSADILLAGTEIVDSPRLQRHGVKG